MAAESPLDLELEERRNRVLLDFVEAREAGAPPDRERWLEAHPDLEPDLADFLAGDDELRKLAAPLGPGDRPGGGALGESRGPDPGESIAPLGTLGDYQILREVGRGGMGVVYEAEQISLRRRVALKVLPFAAAIEPRRLQRFKTEALAAASVEHESIVPVYAVGCERGVHFYAMQFIDGGSLAMVIDDLRSIRERSRPAHGAATADGSVRGFKGLSQSHETAASRRHWLAMAGLIRQAALALDQAHQAGIVHRDIKPGNLLLDGRGRVWVTDFGLAQVSGAADPGLTLTGEMPGTLRYSGPERVAAGRGAADERTDVYSLGATLYELLTLQPPFVGRDRNALIRKIVDEEPAAPRSIDPSIPVALETITRKAMRKESADRYASARDFADDLARFMENRPIRARRPSVRERVRAWTRRHPAWSASASAALVLITAASLCGMVLIRREQSRTNQERRKAEAAYLREQKRALEAESRFRLARRAVDELIRTSEEELASRPGMEGLRKRLLAGALTYYREFIAERRSDPGAQAELLDTSRRVETILADLAVLRAAGQLYLLIQPTADDELRLDDVQRRRVAELSSRASERWTKAFGDSSAPPAPPSRRARIALDLARANEREIDLILTPAQHARLRQIALQSEGPAAFREPEVVEALGLTSVQREKIRAIEDETFMGRFRDMQSGRRTEDTSIARILELLTPEQGRRWSELAGAPVKGPLSVFPMPIRPREPAR